MNPLKKISSETLVHASESMLKLLEDINKNQKVLENHMITIQENQVETEQYLKEIRDHVKKETVTIKKTK